MRVPRSADSQSPDGQDPGVLAAGTAVACADTFDPAPDGTLTIGTWGAEGAGVIVSETGTHVHIGCTFGDIEGTILVIDGRFTVDGSYMLRAYPVAVGPMVPAQFSGQLVGPTLTLAVAVDDTVENQLVSLGPVTVAHGRWRNAPSAVCRRTSSRRRTTSQNESDGPAGWTERDPTTLRGAPESAPEWTPGWCGGMTLYCRFYCRLNPASCRIRAWGIQQIAGSSRVVNGFSWDSRY